MKSTLLRALIPILLAVSAFGQDTTACTELRRTEITVCERGDGAATVIYHGHSEYNVTEFDAKTWKLDRDSYFQKEVDAEAGKTTIPGPPSLPAPAAQLPPTDFLNSKAAAFKSKKDCVAAGFKWDKSKHGKTAECYFQ